MGVGLEWDAEGPAEPQVGDLELELGPVDEEVLRLEVAVEDAVLVAVAHALDELPHEPLHDVHGHRRRAGALAKERERRVRREKNKDEERKVRVSVVGRRRRNE